MVETSEVSQSNQPPTKDACTWAMICHLAGMAWGIVPIIGGVIAPLIIWQMKKDLHPFVNQNGKEALNFQISMLIYFVIAALLCLTCIGVALVPIVGLADIILAIIAAVKAANGEAYRYPLTIRFVS
ncbi:MAG: DUF4870 domain-containing protein [Sedimentisphaerales bacterium]|nr:DUF4870 domain-containing protein [Sedimentisphaerales bacterium]